MMIRKILQSDVERIFSQLKLIRDTCSDSMLEDILEIRMFEMCNGDLNDLYKNDN